MNRRSLTVRVLCGLMLSGVMAGCSDSRSPTGPTGGPTSPTSPQVVDRTFTLALSESASVSNGTSELRLGFKRVVSDNRCPGDAMCVAGLITPAILEFGVTSTENVTTGSVSMTSLTHLATDGPNSELRVGVYSVRIEALAPYRFASLPPIKDEDWRVTIRIKSATN
jgi:hypothetical protein